MLDIFKTVLITSLVFIPMEFIFPRIRGKKILRKDWIRDVLYAFIAGSITLFGITIIIVAGHIAIEPFLSEGFKTAIGSQPVWLQIVEIIIIADLIYYWIHRMFHENPYLWKIHAIHHSIEEMDWLAAHRVHPIDQILTRGGSLIIPFSFGFSAAPLSIFFLIIGWLSYLKHSNVKIHFGPLKWLIVSPTFHHWHHANEEHAFDKNYADLLPILDILFKTAVIKEDNGPEKYGTDTVLPETFLGQLILPLKLLFNRSKTIKPKSIADIPGEH